MKREPKKKYFRYNKPLGRKLEYRREQGCDWCWHGTRPKTGVCEACAHTLHNLLCSKRWSVARIAFLSEPGNELCRRCLSHGFYNASEEVNHVHPWRDCPDLFWNPEYWEPLCKSCHSQETVSKHGGFGRDRQPDAQPPEE